MRRALLLCMLAVVAVDAAGCATAAPQSLKDTRRLRALERSFHGFVAVKLHNLEEVEDATAALEQLRMDYLDALADESSDERDRLWAMLRLAELHLDLSARVRRVPYSSTDVAVRAGFDAALSQHALPLEATGQGILEQILQRADRAGVDGRFVARAPLPALAPAIGQRLPRRRRRLRLATRAHGLHVSSAALLVGSRPARPARRTSLRHALTSRRRAACECDPPADR